MPQRSEPVNYAPGVLRLGDGPLHFATWALSFSDPGPLCRTRGAWWNAEYGTSMDFPEVPICKRCIGEVQLFTYAIKGRA